MPLRKKRLHRRRVAGAPSRPAASCRSPKPMHHCFPFRSAFAAHITLTLRNAHYSVMVKHSIQSIIERGDIAIAPPGPSSR